MEATFTDGQKERMLAEFEYFRSPNAGQRTSCRAEGQPCARREETRRFDNYGCCNGLFCNQLEGRCST